jgi:hypothetical protein
VLRSLVDKKALVTLNKFNGRLSPDDHFFTMTHHHHHKAYKRIVLTRWHLFVRLSLNKELIVMRKHFIKRKTTNLEQGIVDKVKDKLLSLRSDNNNNNKKE